MTIPKIVGLVGFIGSGKDTVAKILTAKYGYHPLAFADVLKDGVSIVFGWPRHFLEGDTPESRDFREKEDEFWSRKLGKKITPRLVLQKFGTEGTRDIFGEDIWVSALERRIEQKHYKKIVITDVRFPNEIKFIEDQQEGYVFRVSRGESPIWYHVAEQENTVGPKGMMEKKYPNAHYSEWAWIGHSFDAVIDNNNSLEDLRESVKVLVDTFGLR